MRHRCPAAITRGRATLGEHELTFVGNSSRWRGGVATIIAGTVNTRVMGLLYELSEDDLATLDRHEGIQRGAYQRRSVSVTDEAGLVHLAVTFVHMSTQFAAPSSEYFEILRSAYERLGFEEAPLRMTSGSSLENATPRDGDQ